MKWQRKYSLCFILLLMFHSPITASKVSDKEKCLKVKEKIEVIHKKMRHKYSSKQGEKYRRKLDKLYKEEFKYCF